MRGFSFVLDLYIHFHRAIKKSGLLLVNVKYIPFHQGPDDPKPAYSFELTTNFFAIDPSGMLVVNEENLDRDPPSPGRFRFQVVAREKTGVAASAPLSFVVILNDVNDNAPMLPMIPPITVQAGETKKVVTKVNPPIFFSSIIPLYEKKRRKKNKNKNSSREIKFSKRGEKKYFDIRE